MNIWLLILMVVSQSGGAFSGGGGTDVTMLHFESRALCESAAKQTEKEVDRYGSYKARVSYKCLHRDASEWR